MYQVSFEEENRFGVCSVLEDADVEAMTDQELLSKLKMWDRSLDDDDPLAWAVSSNCRLLQRHLDDREHRTG